MLNSIVTAICLGLPSTPPPEAAVSADRLMATVRSLPHKRAGSGDDESRANLLALPATFAGQALAMGYWPTLEPVRWRRRGDAASPDWRNVVFEIPGRTRPDEVIIVGAHFDAVPAAPGADDNGSGVAGLLEMARVLHGGAHHRTIRFVLFNLEEFGHYGANQYAASIRESHRAGTPRIVGMLSLEMLGFYSDQPGSQKSPFKGVAGVPVTDVGDFLAFATIASASPFVRALDAAARSAEPGFKSVVIDMFPIAPPDLLRSDHTPFMLMGVPAVMVTDTANFRNPHYHKPTDLPDTLHPEMFARSVRALTGAVRALAGPVEAGPPPEWVATPPRAPKPDPADTKQGEPAE